MEPAGGWVMLTPWARAEMARARATKTAFIVLEGGGVQGRVVDEEKEINCWLRISQKFMPFIYTIQCHRRFMYAHLTARLRGYPLGAAA